MKQPKIELPLLNVLRFVAQENVKFCHVFGCMMFKPNARKNIVIVSYCET